MKLLPWICLLLKQIFSSLRWYLYKQAPLHLVGMWWLHRPPQDRLSQAVEKYSLGSRGVEDRQSRTILVQPGEWIFSSLEKWDILSSTSPLKFTENINGNQYIWCIKPSVTIILGFQLCKKPKKSDYNIKHLQTEKKILVHTPHISRGLILKCCLISSFIKNYVLSFAASAPLLGWNWSCHFSLSPNTSVQFFICYFCHCQ